MDRSDSVLHLTKADRLAGGLAVVALIAGIVVLWAGSGLIVSTIGVALLGLAGIAFTSLVFLLIGESEERDHKRGILDHKRGVL
jgi:hypothetical protein